MIPHLACRLRFEKLPVSRHGGRPRRLLAFEVHQTAGSDPATCIQQGDVVRESSLTERRIHEYDVERPPIRTPGGLPGGTQEARSAHFHDSGLGCSTQPGEFGHQSPGGRLGLLDEHHTGSAARQGLKPQGAGAGEQIQTAGTDNGVLQPVVQSLAHSIGRRPQPGNIGETDSTAAPAAADDADGIAAVLRRRGRVGRLARLGRWHPRHHTR